MRGGRILSWLGKVVPLLGWGELRWRYPRLRCGLGVDIAAADQALTMEGHAQVGARTRIYLTGMAKFAIGTSVVLGQGVHVQSDGGLIQVGAHTGVQDGCRLYGEVSIGEHCLLAPNVYLSSGRHVFSEEPHRPILDQERRHRLAGQPIVVEDDCWLGINVVVMPGVTIGKGSVVGANAVVTKNVEPYSVVAGAPARLIRRRLDFVPPAAIDASRVEDWPYFYHGFDVLNPHPDYGLACRPQFKLGLAVGERQAVSLRVFATTIGALSANGQAVELQEGWNEIVIEMPASSMQAFAINIEGWVRTATVVEMDEL